MDNNICKMKKKKTRLSRIKKHKGNVLSLQKGQKIRIKNTVSQKI